MDKNNNVSSLSTRVNSRNVILPEDKYVQLLTNILCMGSANSANMFIQNYGSVHTVNCAPQFALHPISPSVVIDTPLTQRK